LQDIPQTDIEKSVLSNRILGTSTVQELASILQVSESTIYRTENALRVKIERAIKDG
jgi:DNA-directed RNA polymerase specialized sigma subunit